MKYLPLFALFIFCGCNKSVSNIANNDPNNIKQETWNLLDKAEIGDKDSLTNLCADLLSEKSNFPEATRELIKKNKNIMKSCSKLTLNHTK